MTTKRASRRTTSGAASPSEPFWGLTAPTDSTLDAFVRAGQTYANGLAALNEEMASFMQTRLRHDMALGESMMQCRSWADVAQLQSDWVKETTEDYTANAKRLFELGSSMVRDSWGSLREPATTSEAEEASVALKG